MRQGSLGDNSGVGGMFGRLWRRKPPAVLPLVTPASMLEKLHAGERPDYGLYLRAAAGAPASASGLLSIDIETQLMQALSPLELLTLDETALSEKDAGLPDEAFLTLADNARLLCLVPTAHPRFIRRLRLIKSLGPIQRTLFLMPEQGTLGSVDWATEWQAAQQALRPHGVDLSGYTAGGWLFRLDATGRACTFRPIVNPNPQKIAKAVESICSEMS